MLDLQHTIDRRPTEGKAYLVKANALAKQYYAHKGLEFPGLHAMSYDQWEGLVDWLVDSVRHSVIKRSWNFYKHSIMHVLPYKDLKHKINLKGTRGKSEMGGRGTGVRQKHFKAKDMSKIYSWIQTHDCRWSKLLWVWLQATSLTGLRPNEWSRSSIIYERGIPVLKTFNSKRDTHRKPEYRYIPLNQYDEHEFDYIYKQVMTASQFAKEGVYEAYYRGCSNLLYRITKDLFPQRQQAINIYSARHQFSANLKRCKLKKGHIAYILGHSTEEMQGRWYAKKVNGEVERFSPPDLSLVLSLISDDVIEHMNI